MLVDDEPGIREQAKYFLEDIYGLLDVRTFSNAKEALEELENNYYSAIIADYLMPGMNGLELLRTLRKKDDDTPFIIFTGKGKEEVAMEALNLGADGYIQKGDDPRTQYTFMAQTIKQVVEMHQSNMSLERSEKEKSVILNSISEHVVHMDSDGIIIWANRAATESVGLKAGDIVGEKCHELWFNRSERCEGCPLPKAAETVSRIDSILSPNNERIWYVRVEPVLSDEGEIIGFLEIKDDITDKTKTKEALLDSVEKFRVLVEAAPSAIFILHDGIFKYFNRTTENITGYGDELGSMKFVDMISEEQRELVDERFEALQKGLENVPRRYEVKMIRADGDEKWLYISCGNLIFEGEKCVLLIAIDVTEQKILEDMVRDDFEYT